MNKNSQEIRKARPLSPHLSIYKPQISSVLSIGHRITGCCLYLSSVIISWWFVFWTFSKFDPFYLDIANSIFAKLLVILTIYALFYHFCTGVRHLFWDIGIGFKISTVNKTGWLVVLSSFLLTAIFLLIIMKKLSYGQF